MKPEASPQPLVEETGPYYVFGTATAKPGLGDVLAERLLALVKLTSAEAGALQFRIHHDCNDPDVFAFYEAWASADDFQRHLETPYVLEFLRGRMTYLQHDLDIHFVRLLGSTPTA